MKFKNADTEFLTDAKPEKELNIVLAEKPVRGLTITGIPTWAPARILMNSPVSPPTVTRSFCRSQKIVVVKSRL